MSGVNLGFAVEGLVVILLSVTIGYCIMLEKRLRRFRADEKGMRQTVVDLALATERAEKAIHGLRATLTEADGSLVQRLKAAESFTRELDAQLKSGGQVLARISKIVASSRSMNAQEEIAEDHISMSEPIVEQETRVNRLADMLSAARAMADRARNHGSSNRPTSQSQQNAA